MTRRRFASGLAAFLVLTSVALGLWVHRLHIERPSLPPAILNSDIQSYFYPVAIFMHREIRAGRWPLWNPHQLAGMPFMALQVPGVLNPLNRLIMRWIEPARALEVQAVLHLVIAGFFTWLFAGSLGLGPPARLAAAFAFMLAQTIWRDIYCPSFLTSSVWLPAVLWSLRGVVVTGRPQWAVAMSVALSLAFLAGHAQGFLFQAQLAVLYGLFCFIMVTPRGMRGRVLALLVFAAVLTVGLTAVQLLPSVELAQQGTRSLGGLPILQASFGSVFPSHLISGAVGRLSFLLPENLQGLYLSVTLSTLTVPLVLLGLADRKHAPQWAFFLVIWIVTGLFMLGVHTPVYRAYYSLPLGDLFRGPVRISFVYAFSAAVLIGIGVQGATRLVPSRNRNGRAATIIAGLLAVAVAADLYHATRLEDIYLSRHPEDELASRELVQGLELRAPLGRIFSESHIFVTWSPLREKMGTISGMYVVPDYEPILPGDYGLYFDAPDDPPWHGSMSVLASRSSALRDEFRRLLDLMSVEYYILSASRGPLVRKALEEFVDNDAYQVAEAYVSRRRTSLPRAYIVNRVIHEPDKEKALRILKSASFDPRRAAVVDSRLPEFDNGSSHADGRVLITSYQPESVRLKASCRAPCLLVLTDLHYPGWFAHVDGKPVEIHRANFLFRGIQLGPGSHEVTFRFRPRSFLLGSYITILALLVAAGVLIAATPWKKIKAPSGIEAL